MTGDDFVSRLDGVRRSGKHSWLARCPSHQDRSPSLHVTEADDGSLLIKCFAGCGAHEVVGAMGLQIDDLFPEKREDGKKKYPINPMDALMAVNFESLVVLMCANKLRQGEKLNEYDHKRLSFACATLAGAVDYVKGRNSGWR